MNNNNKSQISRFGFCRFFLLHLNSAFSLVVVFELDFFLIVKTGLKTCRHLVLNPTGDASQ
jgi:hypothetical protein